MFITDYNMFLEKVHVPVGYRALYRPDATSQLPEPINFLGRNWTNFPNHRNFRPSLSNLNPTSEFFKLCQSGS